MNTPKKSTQQCADNRESSLQEKRSALGSVIKERRVEQGLSQAKLALMVGSSKAHIWRIETGRVSVGIDDLSRIADALDTTTSSLIPF